MNLRGHVPETCGWPPPYTRSEGEGVSTLPGLALHADYLAQRVYHVHQIALRFHHGIDGLLRHRSFVDDIYILTTLDNGCCLRVVVQREAALRLRTRQHGTSGSMTTAREAFRVALAAHDVRTRTHAAGNDSHIALTTRPRSCCASHRTVPSRNSLPADEEAAIELQPGDVMLAFTDGVSEALNPDQEEFGEERLKQLLCRVADLPAHQILSAISG